MALVTVLSPGESPGQGWVTALVVEGKEVANHLPATAWFFAMALVGASPRVQEKAVEPLLLPPHQLDGVCVVCSAFGQHKQDCTEIQLFSQE